MRFYTITGLMAALLVSGCAVTPPPKVEEDHSALHPEGSAPATAAIQTAPIPTRVPDAFNRQLQAMEAMHRKIQAAKTPAKRAALMEEQMKLMRSGMVMIGQMRGAAAAGAEGISAMGDMMGMQLQMERRMAMTEQMMQMMMDRLPAPAGAGAEAKHPKVSK
ncbi:MAG: hypothetical protein RLZZ22_1540 [Pseudomonadota bacterium]|jgi:hypothetical protein